MENLAVLGARVPKPQAALRKVAGAELVDPEGLAGEWMAQPPAGQRRERADGPETEPLRALPRVGLPVWPQQELLQEWTALESQRQRQALEEQPQVPGARWA